MSKNKKKTAVKMTAAEKKALEKKQEKKLTAALLGVAAIAIILVIVLVFGGRTKPKLRHVEIEVENYGTIKAELDESIAPVTVANFIDLAESGFYDGITFHRIMDGFMIQGGDPTGTGHGGSDQKIKGEFTANGFENSLSHKRGVLSMARSNDYNSASSQFFIVQSDSLFLDGNYAGFGWVTDGMEIVDAICRDTPVQDNNGTVLPEDQPVITSIRVLD